MLKKLSLKAKLVAICVALTIVPVLLVGGFSLWQLKSFSGEVLDLSYAGLEKQAQSSLTNGLMADRERVLAFINKAQGNVLQLAASSNMKAYLESTMGKNNLLNTLAAKEVNRIVEGLIDNCSAQQALIQKQLDGALAVSEHLLNSKGAATLTSLSSDWMATNLYNADQQKISLPVLRIGEIYLDPDRGLDNHVPIVDDAGKMVPGTYAIFQKMSQQGDMLTVATNVRKPDGTRTTGTFIPAVQPDGKRNPIIAKILSGETYRGRELIADQWYITSYRPLRDEAGQLIGMLNAGVSEQQNSRLDKTIRTLKIGQSGYVFVMDSQGNLLLHPRSELVGKNAISDLHVEELRKVLDEKTAGQVKSLSYQWEGKNKFISYSYFPAWDWIICASGYWEEFSMQAAEVSMASLKSEVEVIYHSFLIEHDGKTSPVYNQIRYINDAGQEIVKLMGGQFSNALASKADQPWFKACLNLKKGEVFNSGVEIAANTGKPEMRLVSPVYEGEAFKGVMVLNLDWQLAWQLIKEHVYGETGYAYIINDKAELVSHPKYDLTNPVDIGDPKYGELADIVKKEMLPGKLGVATYTFEGIHKEVSFAPLQVGDKIYSIAATCPLSEFFEMANNIKASVVEKTIRMNWILAIAAIGMILLGSLVGFFSSNSIARPLLRIVGGIEEGIQQVSAAAGEVSTSSQSVAEGASQQAASIEETSSALEEISSMTRQNAENSDQANNLMSDAAQAVQVANSSMNNLTKAIEEVRQSSEETQKIVRTIDEIAFQTNLLALNAAVEAARAGEAGAGFAVVADEVRNLAMRSAEAAKNTAALIEGTVQRVRGGSELVKETSEAFSKVSITSDKAAALVAEVTAASKEQSVGIEEVNKAVGEMDKVVQQNAANAEESASAAEQLNAQSHQMKEYVGELEALVAGNGKRWKANMAEMKGYGSEDVKLVKPNPSKNGRGERGERNSKKREVFEETRAEYIIPFEDEESTRF